MWHGFTSALKAHFRLGEDRASVAPRANLHPPNQCHTTVSGLSNVSAMLVLGLPGIYLKRVCMIHCYGNIAPLTVTTLFGVCVPFDKPRISHRILRMRGGDSEVSHCA